MTKLKSLDGRAVTLLPGLFCEHSGGSRAYLKELRDPNLLQSFYMEAVIDLPNGNWQLDDPGTADMHWGWESPTCMVRGHFLGHWLSAAAMQIAANDDRELKVKFDFIIDELERCQTLNGGRWLGPIPEKYFDAMASGRYAMAPSHVLTVVLIGLKNAYIYGKNEKCLKLISGLCDWFLDWTAKFEGEDHEVIFLGEGGGLLEIWATMYQLTGDERYHVLMDRYGRCRMYDDLLAGCDVLTGFHANTTIPFAQSAAKMYEVTGEEKWLKICQAFYKSAEEDRTPFATGAANDGEFWVAPGKTGRFIGPNTQEFCTVYNMVHFVEYLYRFTGDVKYADYIEKALYNGFLAQHNPATGTPTYFLSLNGGAHKHFGHKTRGFWCCYGTTVEAQARYPMLCYYTDGADTLTVAQYIPSKFTWEENGHNVTAELFSNIQWNGKAVRYEEQDETGTSSRWSFAVDLHTEPDTFTLALRVPSWLRHKPVIRIGGQTLENVRVEDGYIRLNRRWESTRIEVFFRPSLELAPLPDRPAVAAVREGPIVLAALTDADKGLTVQGNLEHTLTPLLEHTYGTFAWTQSTYHTDGQQENYELIPLYAVRDEAYTVYLTVSEK